MIWEAFFQGFLACPLVSDPYNPDQTPIVPNPHEAMMLDSRTRERGSELWNSWNWGYRVAARTREMIDMRVGGQLDVRS